MVRVKSFGKMVPVTQARSLQVKRTGMGFTNGRIRLLMRVVGSTTGCVGRAPINGVMGELIQANG
jgi:hypothetical protein